MKTRRVFEEICEQIRQELAVGKLKPGDKLPAERELALQFSVSRTAVREALRSLEMAGIVRLHKGVKGGAFILEGNPEAVTQSIRDMMSLGRISIDSLTEARLLILEAVVRLACQRASLADFDDMARNIDRTEEVTLAGQFPERMACSLEFYQLLAKPTRNEALSVIVESLTQILLHFIVRVGPSKLDVIGSRRRLLKHLRARNADKAIHELSTHLKRVHKYLMEHERQIKADKIRNAERLIRSVAP